MLSIFKVSSPFRRDKDRKAEDLGELLGDIAGALHGLRTEQLRDLTLRLPLQALWKRGVGPIEDIRKRLAPVSAAPEIRNPLKSVISVEEAV